MQLRLSVIAGIGLLAACASASATIFTPGDPIVAIDLDTLPSSSSPGNEGPENALDSDPSTKYLNFGENNSGFIVTLAEPVTVQSFQLTTANDAVERDPASWSLYGTNSPIISENHSNGMDEPWTLIGMGSLALPAARLTLGPVVPVAITTSYSSYRMVFPTVKNAAAANSMQFADVGFFASSDGSGANLLGPGLDIRAFDLDPPASQSNHPANEAPRHGIDRSLATKYLNFGEENSGFIITPSVGPTVVKGFQITTANDAELRDPATWEIYGTNSPIVSTNNSAGTAEPWTLIDSGAVDLPTARRTLGPLVSVNNTTAYASYRVIFPTVKDAAAANSMQLAEIQFFPESVLGDFNNNGRVDAADYVLWRNGGPLQNEGGTTPGTATPEDYQTWRTNFGRTPGAGAAAASGVPEATTLLSAYVALLVGIVTTRGRRS